MRSIEAPMRRTGLVSSMLLALTAACSSTPQQPTSPQPQEPPQEQAPPQQQAPAQEQAPPQEQQGRQLPPNPRHADYTHPLPANSIELALGTDAYHLSYRGLLHPGGGYGQLEWLGDSDNNKVVSARLMRFTARDRELPLTFGVGIGAYGAFRDDPGRDSYALSLIGSVYYDFATEIPTNVGVDFSYAPDISTFESSDRLIDATASFGMDLSPWASAFLGYRYLSIDYSDDTDFDFANQIMIGVRLAW